MIDRQALRPLVLGFTLLISAVPAQSNDLADALSAATETVLNDGRYSTLYEKWFGAPLNTLGHPAPPCGAMAYPKLSASGPKTALQAVLDSGEIRFGFALLGPPYSVDDGGGPTGWDIELAVLLTNALSEAYGKPLRAKHVRVDGAPFPGRLLDALDGNAFDAALSDLAITVERQRRADFSCPYLAVSFGLLSRCSGPAIADANDANRSGVSVIILRRGFLNELADRHLDQATQVFVDDPQEIPKALLENRAATALLPFPSIRAYQREHEELCVQPFQVGPDGLRGIAVRKTP